MFRYMIKKNYVSKKIKLQGAAFEWMGYLASIAGHVTGFAGVDLIRRSAVIEAHKH